MIQNHPLLKHPLIDSAVSYAFGIFSFILASLPQIASVAQSLSIIIGLIVLIFRAIYDGRRTMDYLRSRNKP